MGIQVWVHDVGELRALRQEVHRLACAAGAVAGDITLATNELATNALCHAGSPCYVAGSSTGGTATGGTATGGAALRLAVTDIADGPLRLDAFAPQPDAAGGRGLAIVAAIVSRWGVEPATWGKTVWFEVDLC